MNFAQRAFLYVTRKRGKALGLFLLNFTVAVFLVSSFGVLNASEMLSGDIRSSLGAAFYIRAKTEISANDFGETAVREAGANITQNAVDEIMKIGGIARFNPINYGFAKSDEIRFIPGDRHTPESDMGAVTALGFSALAPDFADKTAVLISGNHIIESDRGKILISERLANANHLSVGDTVTLTHAKLGEIDGEYVDEIAVKTAFYRVEVAGIYRLKTDDAAPKPTAGLSENGIYASLDVLNELNESEEGVYTGEVGFFVADPSELDGIIRRVRAVRSIDWSSHFIRTNDFRYSEISDGMKTLVGLTKTLLVLVSTVGAAVLILMLTLCIRGRLREAGIMLAAGISKSEILAQFLLEVLSVTALALIFSHAASLCVSGTLERALFGSLPGILSEKALTAGVNNSGYMTLGGAKIALIYLCQISAVTASTLISSAVIMRLSPKEILSKMI